jgi:predicted SAM-dependent methyltransferase
VSPKYCLSRKLIAEKDINYTGIALEKNLNIGTRVDLLNIPFSAEIFDCIICIHVLEHIPKDTTAIRELYRVLKPGGWASISVPIRLDQKTYEDPSIVTKEDRKREFGETSHVRFYGYDLKDRLEAVGFEVHLNLAKEINQEVMDRYGLIDDENIFFCRKPSMRTVEKLGFKT